MVYYWVFFHIIIFLILGFDLFYFQKKPHKETLKEAIIFSVIYIGIGLLYGYVIHFKFSSEDVIAYFSAFFLEKSLSVDNLFVFYVVFRYFNVDKKDEHKILFYGILGAIVFRLIFIAGGIALVKKFHFLFYVFGLFLIYSGYKLFKTDKEVQYKDNKIVKLVEKYLPFLPKFLLVIIAIELSDIMFAVDSVPAVIGITHNIHIAYTSNVFAILGLRALYFVLEGIINAFKSLHFALAFILIFIGIKMLIMDFIKIPVLLSLFIILFSVVLAIAYDLNKFKKKS